MLMKWYAEENTRKKFNNIKLETAEEFLARGGSAQKVKNSQSSPFIGDFHLKCYVSTLGYLHLLNNKAQWRLY